MDIKIISVYFDFYLQFDGFQWQYSDFCFYISSFFQLIFHRRCQTLLKAKTLRTEYENQRPWKYKLKICKTWTDNICFHLVSAAGN